MRHLIASIAFFLAGCWPACSTAATMSDLWWNPNESGWGVNIIEQQGTLFVTMFVYGTDGQPTWYFGSDVREIATTSGRLFTGAFYTTVGPWFGGGFNPNAVSVRQVGNLTFAANTPVSGTLTYSVDGVPVTKTIERQTWKHINLGGTYYGASDALSSSTCSVTGPAALPFYSAHTITATVYPNGRQGGITMTITDTSGTSTFSGNYTQYGALYEVVGTMTISGSLYNATIRDFTADDDGIRGNIYLLSAAGCYINVRFSAVRPG
jgi:hypothetical protein